MKTIQDIIEAFDRGAAEFLFFWGENPAEDGMVDESCLSQWYPSPFVADGMTYHTAEQYMMTQKAKLFDDSEIFNRIMESSSPEEYKSLGRLVKRYDDSAWDANRFKIVIDGNRYKFAQNKSLLQYLLSTGDRVLVEASSDDCIWGIGLSMDHPDCYDPHKWQGKNLLGFALMEVRASLADHL